jgi:hypothetical protein
MKSAAAEALGAALVDVQPSRSIITQRLAEFHRTLAELLANVAHMRLPVEAALASGARDHRQSLVNVGDASVDAVRLRLLAVHSRRDAAKRSVGHTRLLRPCGDQRDRAEDRRRRASERRSPTAPPPRRSRRAPKRAALAATSSRSGRRSATWPPHSWNPHSSR